MNITTKLRRIEPSVYVGTYHKYNCGSIDGDWVSLEGHDKESFYEACKELHKDEADPEFMFQDYEHFPKEFYGESGLDDEIWEWLALDEYDRMMVDMYEEAVGNGRNITDANDAFYGKYDSEEDFAVNFAEETGAIPRDCPRWITSCIDWNRVWESELTHSFCTSSDGNWVWVFRR
jgi:antirestriction protein